MSKFWRKFFLITSSSEISSASAAVLMDLFSFFSSLSRQSFSCADRALNSPNSRLACFTVRYRSTTGEQTASHRFLSSFHRFSRLSDAGDESKVAATLSTSCFFLSILSLKWSSLYFSCGNSVCWVTTGASCSTWSMKDSISSKLELKENGKGLRLKCHTY